MKKYSELYKSLKPKTQHTESYCNYDRESYVSGNLFKVGDIVEHRGRKAEIINIGSNYVTLIREGKTFRSWITDVSHPINECKQVSPKLKGEQLSYKGYTTKNFTISISENFLDKYKDVDAFAFYNCLVGCDNLLTVNSVALVEFYNRYKIDYDRVNRYLNKFDINIPRITIIGEALELIREHNAV